MALTTPVLFNFPAFDAKVGYTFVFNVVGGSLVKKNKLIIRKNSDNSIVYQEVQETEEYKHVLPPDVLVNNIYYNARIVTIDAQGNESNPSTPIQFWCYTTPTIRFTNLLDGQTIENSFYRFEFEYNQVEGEKLNSYEVSLYDVTGKIIATSGRKLPTNDTLPYVDIYAYSGLIDGTTYSIELEAITVQDTIISTGKVRFNVKYGQSPVYSQLEAKNNCLEGYVLVSSDVNLIVGSTGKPVSYINNKEIDLTNNDFATFRQGYGIQDNFALRVWFRKPKFWNEEASNYPTLVYITNPNEPKPGQIFIDMREGYEKPSDTTKKVYAQIEAIEDGNTYYIYSNYINKLPDNQYYFLCVKRENNLYSIELKAK